MLPGVPWPWERCRREVDALKAHSPALANRLKAMEAPKLDKLSVVDHHFDQFGDLVSREVTRI